MVYAPSISLFACRRFFYRGPTLFSKIGSLDGGAPREGGGAPLRLDESNRTRRLASGAPLGGPERAPPGS